MARNAETKILGFAYFLKRWRQIVVDWSKTEESKNFDSDLSLSKGEEEEEEGNKSGMTKFTMVK